MTCRDCGEQTGNRTERCGPCRDKFNKGERVQSQEIIDYKYNTGSKEHICKECNEPSITLVDGVCNTCLSKKDADDVIDWPKHYNTGKIQPIDAIEDWKLDFRLANAVKYIARCEHKEDPKKDLEKALWYIQRYIDKECKDDKKQ